MIGISQAILLHAEEGMGSLVVLLLAERAPSEGPRSTRAIEDQPGYPMKRSTSELGRTMYDRGRLMRAVKDSLATPKREVVKSPKRGMASTDAATPIRVPLSAQPLIDRIDRRYPQT